MWPRSSTSTTRAYGECSIITFRRRLKGSISARSSRSRRTRRRRAAATTTSVCSWTWSVARSSMSPTARMQRRSTASRRFWRRTAASERITDASIDMGAAFIAGVKANFPNAKITFDKFHVIKLVNEAVDEVRRTEAKHNDWIKGTRYLWLKNLQNLDAEEKAAIARLEAANLDTMQAWQIRLNLQDVFTMPSVASARKFLYRWYAWVSTCDLAPMKKAAFTIMAKADDILRSIGNNLSNGLLEAIN